MKIFLFEDNLMWSSKLSRSLKALGHEPLLMNRLPADLTAAQVAIVNLGTDKTDLKQLVQKLQEAGVHVIAHAGHKEKELLSIGKDLGCDTLATNSEITFKIEKLLSQINLPDSQHNQHPTT